MNWFPSTGTISFQGPNEGRIEVEQLVKPLLAELAGSSSSAVPSQERQACSPVPDTLKNSGTERTPAIASLDARQTESSREASSPSNAFLGQRFATSELVIGLVGAVGTELRKVIDILSQRLTVFNYVPKEIGVSKCVIPLAVALPEDFSPQGEYAHISTLMNAGDKAREQSGDNSILALGIAATIAVDRPQSDDQPDHRPRHAYIVSSLKHPAEVRRLREIYPEAFYLIGVHADAKRRHHYLTEEKRLKPEEAEALIQRDEDEHLPYGQKTTDTFHMSDFFVQLTENQDQLKYSLWRILDILFGHPYATPTFDEYAMFMAFAASLRSADLSRQVGAVVTKEKEIIATGANDCPKFGGGLYWPDYDEKTFMIGDSEAGRDYKRGEDSNKIEQIKIIDQILDAVGPDLVERERLREALMTSRIKDITEYGRVVHAEMEALLCCSRNHVSARRATLYCTTFSCHNCAKHIIAAGVIKVVYIEPYPKSKAVEFHSDSISLGFTKQESTVQFEPFVGVGPRRFFDLFSMQLGSGYSLERKKSTGQVVQWEPENAELRIPMIPISYLGLELLASSMFEKFIEKARPGQ